MKNAHVEESFRETITLKSTGADIYPCFCGGDSALELLSTQGLERWL